MLNEKTDNFGIIAKSVMLNKNINIIAKAIYAYLSIYANIDKSNYPTRQKIQEDLGISQDTLSKYLKHLEKSKVIIRICERNKGKFTTNIYKIISEKPAVDFFDSTNKINSVKDYYKKNINADIQLFEEKQIEQWFNDGYTEDLIKECINISVKNNKPTLNYICGILRNLKRENIKTLDDYNHREQKRKSETRNKFNNVNFD